MSKILPRYSELVITLSILFSHSLRIFFSLAQYSQTAFFIVPNGIRHGEDLLCSHKACRSGGVRFRYCAVCGVPVARRNFRQRHYHHGEAVNTERKSECQDLGAVTPAAVLDHPKCTTVSQPPPTASTRIHNSDNNVETVSLPKAELVKTNGPCLDFYGTAADAKRSPSSSLESPEGLPEFIRFRQHSRFGKLSTSKNHGGNQKRCGLLGSRRPKANQETFLNRM
jgi:hypothetical protein